MEDMMFDVDGRMWLTPCDYNRQLNHVFLFQFDGYEFRLKRKGIEELAKFKYHTIEGFTEEGLLFGMVGNQSYPTEIPDYNYINVTEQFTQVFIYNSITETIQIIKAGADQPDLHFLNLRNTGRQELQLFAESPDQFHLFNIRSGALHLEWSIDKRTNGIPIIKGYHQSIFKAEDEVWLLSGLAGLSHLLQIDMVEKKIKKYRFDEIPGYLPSLWLLEKPNYFGAIKKSGHELYFLKKTWNLPLSNPRARNLYRLDKEKGKFVYVDAIPDGWTAHGIFKDKSDHVLFLLKDKNTKYRAILQDKDNKRYDYSAIVNTAGIITNIRANDFTKQAYIFTQKNVTFIR